MVKKIGYVAPGVDLLLRVSAEVYIIYLLLTITKESLITTALVILGYLVSYIWILIFYTFFDIKRLPKKGLHFGKEGSRMISYLGIAVACIVFFVVSYVILSVQLDDLSVSFSIIALTFILSASGFVMVYSDHDQLDKVDFSIVLKKIETEIWIKIIVIFLMSILAVVYGVVWLIFAFLLLIIADGVMWYFQTVYTNRVEAAYRIVKFFNKKGT